MPTTEIEVPLASEADWSVFVEHNRDALEEHYGSVENAHKHACDGGLTLGGGASPIVRVYFVDE